MAQAESNTRIGPTSTRDAIRWGLLLAAVAVAGFRLPRAFGDLRAWREVRLTDPSAASFYWTSFQVSVIGIAIILCVGIAFFYLLRQRAERQ
jgi:ABC-type Fe3+ transport system permease subunit